MKPKKRTARQAKQKHPYMISSNWLPSGRLCFWQNDQMNSDRSKAILEERHWENFRGIIK